MISSPYFALTQRRFHIFFAFFALFHYNRESNT